MVLTLSMALLLAADPPKRIETPQGWIEVAPGEGGETEGTLTVVHLPAPPPAETPPPPVAIASPAPPPPRAVHPPCERLLARVLGRIAWLHDLTPTDGPLSPALRASLYPVGSAFANPNEPPIELSWDTELRDLFTRYNRCLLRNP